MMIYPVYIGGHWYGEKVMDDGSSMYLNHAGEIQRWDSASSRICTFPNEKAVRIIAKWGGHELPPRKENEEP